MIHAGASLHLLAPADSFRETPSTEVSLDDTQKEPPPAARFSILRDAPPTLRNPAADVASLARKAERPRPSASDAT
jgi:hypothetical protein